MKPSRTLHRLLSLITLSIYMISGIFGIWVIVPLLTNPVSAAYTESDSDTFAAYKKKLEWALQDMERDFRVNGSVTSATISNVRNLVNECYIRLPDTKADDASRNDTMKKSVDLYLDLADRNKTSQTHIGNAIQQAGRFLSEAQIEQVSASISANPVEWNAPLTTSFLANAKDPSGVNVSDANYIWWTRENGGYRRELWRWPTLTYTFGKEGNYQVFLDVISGSKNKKGKTDVLPASVSQDISVKPRLGNIVLLVNGVNVSNVDTLKINPTLGKIGILFDATASRALSNGTITKTKWDFWNGNTLEYDGSPLVERQIYALQDKYSVNLEITNNQGQTFKKTLQLIVRDPSATINMDKDVVYIGDDLALSAKSYFGNGGSVEYSWQIQDAETAGKAIATKNGSTWTYKFAKVWQYIITLQARSANGSVDSDSKTITVESRPPVINLDSPKPVSTEKPNTIIFDASRSYDPDSKSAKNLSYTWVIDGEKVELDNSGKDGAMGSYTFAEKGTHSVSLTIANPYGKVSTVDKSFDVTSTLTVDMNITPRAAPIGTTVSFQARSKEARFFEWNPGDGSPAINGTTDNISHVYKKTGVYTASLTVKNSDGSASNTMTRTVYVTDTDSPFALIDLRGSNGSLIEVPGACDGNNAFAVNRAENTTIDGGNSINIDGSPSGLTYTWKYLDQIKTGPSFSEKFSELWCFPIELTVKSDRTGASHTSKRYIQIKNIVPKITSIDANVDTTKKDSQKLIVNVTANGARDDDGVITSYIWYYKTESDSEPQNVKITQGPKATFVLPNISEKYTFGVILEDNDGARINSADTITDQSPLIITNDDGNVNLPLITLTVPKSQVLVDENIDFSVTAKNILGIDITNKSEYSWDFDGDGKIDKKTPEPRTTFAYKSSGKYNMKVKVTYNGVSNTKYQVITVKNELKAAALGYKNGDTFYFINTSQWSYDNVKWKIGTRESESPYSLSVSQSDLTDNPILTVSSLWSETSELEITPALVTSLAPTAPWVLSIQTFPKVESGSVVLKSRGDKLLLSLFGNDATEYRIDTDTKIDSDLDGVTDNDADNKDSPSYKDGSAFLVNLSEAKTHTRDMKVTALKNGVTVWSATLSIVLDYIIDTSSDTPNDLSGSGITGISSSDRANLEKLQSKIRSLTSDDRIILTQYYNTLIEWWDDAHDRTQSLVTLQNTVNESTTLSDTSKQELSDLLDLILVGDAQATNEITVAGRVIDGLIKSDDPNRDAIMERLEKIKAHPGNLTENKTLWQEILALIKDDAKISNEDKLLIRSQLLVIVNGWQESVPEQSQTEVAQETSASSWILWFIGWVVKIFVIILVIIAVLFLIGYIAYRLTRKNNDTGFQDFLIDSIAHNKKSKDVPVATPPVSTVSVAPVVENTPVVPATPVVTTPLADPLMSASSPVIVKKTETSPIIVPVIETPLMSDPLTAHIEELQTETPTETTVTTQEDSIDSVPQASMVEVPVAEEVHAIPDWLKPITKSEEVAVGATLAPPTETPVDAMASAGVEPLSVWDVQESDPIPDWLKMPGQEETPVAPVATTQDGGSKLFDNSTPTFTPSEELPDWLKNSVESAQKTTEEVPEVESPIQAEAEPKAKKPAKAKKPVTEKTKTVKKPTNTEASTGTSDIPDWLK